MGRLSAKKRICSLFLAILMAITGLLPAATAFADADDSSVEGIWNIELYYKDSDTIVPSYQEDGTTPYIEYMVEGQELNLTYKLDTDMPDNGYIRWYSETPTLVDVTQEGVVKAFDSSKGAVVRLWIDNEVKTIPLVGSAIATVIEKALFNEYVDVDKMDTDEIIKVVEDLFGSDSLLGKYIESYKGQLVESLKKYLDSINSNIHVELCDADGTVLADDYVQVCVNKNNEWYAEILPNGTHITNKSQINTTVAVGSTVQLYAVTTPVRLNYGVVYSVKSTSIFDSGKVIATVDDSGLVTFKNPGTVTIMVSPDTGQVIDGILEVVNKIFAADLSGTIDTDQVADILIKYVGLDINRNVLKAILDVCFAIYDIAGDAADPVKLTATAVEIIGNLVLQFAYNDTITFNVVDAQPLTAFKITGANTVQEGSQIQLSITDIKPETGDTSDITWTSSDPAIASVDPVTGVITGRDAGGEWGALSKQTCTIYATSAANNITKPYTITVTGKTGKNYLSDVEITGKDYVEMGEETDYSYTVYPKRAAESDALHISWGILTGTDEEGNPTYVWADNENPATDGIGTIDTKGHYTSVDGGNCTIAVKATTGYTLPGDNFYEVSSFTNTFDVTNGVPIESIQINVDKAVGTFSSLNGEPKTVTVEGKEYTYATVKASTQYDGLGASLSASVYPENASNQELKWVVEGSNVTNKISNNTHTATITRNAFHESAFTFNVYAVSDDGKIKSNTVTVCVSKNYVTDNKIDQESIEIINGKQADATHTPTFGGSMDGTYSACYDCNWYSNDESVFTVEQKGDGKGNAVLTAHDVGVATLYCVTADGGIVKSCTVTVYPDKERLRNIVNLCDNTIVKRTNENKTLYNEYMRQLDLAYYVLYDEPMASQSACDTYADELLYAFYKVGGFVGIADVNILGPNKTELDSDHITVSVGAVSNYTKSSYSFSYEVLPSTAMYSDIRWTSSSNSIKVDKSGKCTPAENKACSAIITCTVTDYMGNTTSDSVYLTFAKTKVTGVTVSPAEIVGGKVGETQQLSATVEPTGFIGIADADCKNVYWSSSDESIATVDQNGLVTFVAGGNCTITCTTYDGGFTAECAVNVVTNYTALEQLVKHYNNLALNYINYYPDSWEVYQQALAKAQGMLDYGQNSQAEVDAMITELESAYNGLQKYTEIQNIELYLDGEAAQDFYQYKVSVLVDKGFTYQDAELDLKVRLYPNNGSYKNVTWESSTSDISVTNGECKPTINAPCYGRITCTVTDHFDRVFTDSVWVSFARTPVTSLELSDSNISLDSSKPTHKLTCTVKPTGNLLGASIKEFYWESDDESVATVAQDGTVTFVSAGTTTVRAVSYDGGISAECTVWCDGDRSALTDAIEKSRDVDYTQYEYDYGIAFKNAYDNAVRIADDKAVSQQDINDAADQLNAAYDALADHPYISVDAIDISYRSIARPLTIFGKEQEIEHGTVSDNNAVSINISKSNGYENSNKYSDLVLTSAIAPGNAMYKSISWSVDASSKMNSKVDNQTITLTPDDSNNGAWATVTATVTDHYGRTFTRTITAVMSDNTATGFDITLDEATVYATDTNQTIPYTFSGSPEFTDIIWSSSDENVVKVDSNGVATPVEKGTATITGKTLDGGYTDSIKVNVITDFRALESKKIEYENIVQAAKGNFVYTPDSLDVLEQAVNEAQAMIDNGSATQAEANQMIETLDNAYNSLVEYVATRGVSIAFEEDSDVTEVNEGYIRHSNTISINGTSVTLIPKEEPEGSVYTSIAWESSNPNIAIDDNGVLTNHSSSAGVTKVTCTVKNVFDEEYTSSVYVSFVRSNFAVTGISFSDEMVYGAPAQTAALSPTITPSLASIKDCTYSSSNENVATVDDKGVVTFISQGEAEITVTALDGGYTATIKAYTTWDTSALKAAIESAKSITYTDYAYEYGTAFRDAYERAVTVYENVLASQQEIDDACLALTEAATALEGHEFIAPAVTVSQNGEALENGAYVQVDENNQTAIDIALNDGAMGRISEITTSNENGVTAQVNGNQVAITKTAENGEITVAVKTVDDYGRESTSTFSFKVIEKIITATSIALTADGELITTDAIVYSCGGKYSNFQGVTIGYVPTPENANSITDVSYKITKKNTLSSYVEIDNNGTVSITSAGKINPSKEFVVTIECTVTNFDGSTLTKSVELTITKA